MELFESISFIHGQSKNNSCKEKRQNYHDKKSRSAE